MGPIPLIDIDFSKLKSTRDILRDLLVQVRMLIDKDIEEHICLTEEIWQEESMRIFIEREKNVCMMTLNTTSKIDNLLEEIEEEAWLIFDAELFSKGLAIYRNYM